MKKKQTSSTIERKKEVLANLTKFGDTLYDQIEKGTFPWIKMPSRSIENIYYNTELRQYVLGDKAVRRSSRNIRHIRPFTQLVWTAFFANELTQQRKTSTLRDVYYSAQAYEMSFTDQAESNNVITDLETVANFAREDFNIFPEERSAIFGDLTIEYTVPGYEGKHLNLTSHPDGVMIGPALTSSEFVKTSADKVIAIEKGGLFTRFIEDVNWQIKLFVEPMNKVTCCTWSLPRSQHQQRIILFVHLFFDESREQTAFLYGDDFIGACLHKFRGC